MSTTRIDLAERHAGIAYEVVRQLRNIRLLSPALQGKAYHRCRTLLALHPEWTFDALFDHCVDAIEERNAKHNSK